MLTFPPEELPSLLRSDEEQGFDNPACYDCGCTVRRLVRRCARKVDDPSAEWRHDGPVGGTSGHPTEEYRPPAELSNHHYVATSAPTGNPSGACARSSAPVASLQLTPP